MPLTLNRSQILAKKHQLARKYVEVPEWELKAPLADLDEAQRAQVKPEDIATIDGVQYVHIRHVLIAELSGTERDSFEESMVTGKGKNRDINMKNLRARLCAKTIVDEDGGRLFSEFDINELGQLSGAALDRVFQESRKLSRFTDADVEELAGN